MCQDSQETGAWMQSFILLLCIRKFNYLPLMPEKNNCTSSGEAPDLDDCHTGEWTAHWALKTKEMTFETNGTILGCFISKLVYGYLKSDKLKPVFTITCSLIIIFQYGRKVDLLDQNTVFTDGELNLCDRDDTGSRISIPFNIHRFSSL